MKTIYALLIGINEYNDPRNNLRGCVRDVESIKTYFQTHFHNKDQEFNPLVLKDEKATRANIITGFDHFKKAKDGDICLFHFSGHGSQCPSPKEFAHLDVNKKHQTLVCHDSRSPGGRDLLDKELSYLIWKTTKNKDIQFLAIMDCCHSGSNTRSDYVRVRRFSKASEKSNPISEYLGFEDYTINAAGQYTPPVGHHILLSAASAEETAKEVFFQGKPGGIFTFCLLDLLKEVRNQISYSELINRIRVRIKNIVREQSPQLEATLAHSKDLSFLSDAPKVDFSYILSYEKQKNQWVINAGSLHGITAPLELDKTLLKIENSENEAKVKDVFAHYSVVNDLIDLDKSKTYKAKVKSAPNKAKPMVVAFDKDNDPIGEKILSKTLNDSKSIYFNLTQKTENSQYLIHAKQNHFFLTRLDEVVDLKNQGATNSIHEIQSLFKKIETYQQNAALAFLECLEKMAKWIHLLELINPNTSIKGSEINIRFSGTLDFLAKQDTIPIKVFDLQKDNILNYEKHENRWCRPAFKLNIENTGRRNLWVSLLYMSNNFGIDNRLISKQKLEPQQNVSASFVSNGTTKFIIPIQLEDHFLEAGINSIQEYLKIFICTDEFETNQFNQGGVPFDQVILSDSPLRSLAFETVVQPDWTTIEIPFRIYRDMESLGEVKY